LCLGILALNFLGFHNDLLFHFIAEISTIAISSCLFAIQWVLHDKLENGYFSVLGTGLFFTSFLDLMHILTFQGTNIFLQINISHTMHFWLAARFLQGITLAAAPFYAGKKTTPGMPLFITLFMTIVILIAIYHNFLPEMVLPNGNYTQARLFSEIAILFIFAFASFHFYLRRKEFDRKVFNLIFISILLTIGSELFIFLGTNEFHLVNLLGLDLKILSYFLIFIAVFRIGIEHPQEIFYRSLKSNWEQLDNLINNLNEGIAIIDPQNLFILSNPAANQIFGLPYGKLNSRSIMEFLSKDQKSMFLQKTIQHAGKITDAFELVITRPDRKKRIITFTASPQQIGKNTSGLFIIFRDITEQKKYDKALDKAKVLYQTLFMDAPIRIWENDYSEVKKELNQLKARGIEDFQTYLTQNPEEIKKCYSLAKIRTINKKVKEQYSGFQVRSRPKSFFHIFTEDSYPSLIKELNAIANDQTYINYEIITKDKFGGIHYSIINWYVLPGSEKDYSHIIVSAVDITDRKKAEDLLQASEEKFRSLFENAGVGISFLDLNGNIVLANDKSLEFMSGKPEDFIGKNITEILGNEWGELICERILNAVDSEKETFYEDLITLPVGNKWITSFYSRILDHDKNCRGVQLITNDITAQKQLEGELKSQAKFPEENPNPVIRVSKDGLVLYSNKSGKIILKSWKSKVNGKVPQDIYEMIKSCILDYSTKNFQILYGHKVISLDIVPIQDMGYVNVYGRDITELKKAEAEINKYTSGLEKIVAEKSAELIHVQEQLSRQEKLAFMGQLASGVGHELRNPLAVINNALFVLKSTIKDKDESTREYLKMIDQEIGTADKIISDLLNFARIKTAEKEPTDLHLLINKILDRFYPPENIKVEVNLAQNLPLVFIDHKQIEEVLVNLITNAYEAMPEEGGSVLISTRSKGDQVYLSVQDTGIGIAEENLNRIFEPLFTTKVKGIGLGLTVSKMLTEANQGKMEVKSTTGKGSTFTISIPKYGEESC
jgi:PAS domain S-box-containing protein